MRCKGEEGQTVVVVALAMSIFLIGAVGLAIDGAHLYAQRQMAQAAADAAAQAGIMSIFAGTYNTVGNPAGFTTGGTFICGTTDARTPCAYASQNGFNLSNDVVTVSFPAAAAVPGVNLATNYPVTLLQVTVQRQVNTTLMGLLGTSASTIQANAVAAIVQVLAPVPILVTHPTLTGAFSIGGTPLITICGGPSKSIQVDSSDPAAAQAHGNATVNLSHAGPPDPGNCTSGTGADFGVWGGPSTAPFIYNGGSTGKYLQPASPMQDPLAGVSPPPIPTLAPNPAPLGNGVSGCPGSPRKPCMLYSPGLYPNGIDGKQQTVMFEPGIYYIQSSNGVGCSALCDMYMATGFTDAITGTGWTGNMLIYNTGSTTNPTLSGSINLGANGNVALIGAPANSQYLGMLLFEDRNAAAQTHSLGGGGAMTLQGTVYLTNTRITMLANSAQYQALQLQGGSGSGTLIQGEIIVGTLSMGGNGSIQMNLNNNELDVQEVAMVE